MRVGKRRPHQGVTSQVIVWNNALSRQDDRYLDNGVAISVLPTRVAPAAGFRVLSDRILRGSFMCAALCSPVSVIAPVGLTLECFRTRFVMRGIIRMISEN